MVDFIGLNETVKKVLEIGGIKSIPYAPEKKPEKRNGERLIGIVGQGIKAYAIDVTGETNYQMAYQAYRTGLALDFRILAVPEEKLDDVYAVISRNSAIQIERPSHEIETVVVSLDTKPLDSVREFHEMAIRELQNSSVAVPTHRAVNMLQQIFKNEAGVCGSITDYRYIIDTYVSGLSGKNEESIFNKKRIMSELNNIGIEPEEEKGALAILQQYDDLFKYYTSILI